MALSLLVITLLAVRTFVAVLIAAAIVAVAALAYMSVRHAGREARRRD